MTAIQGPFSGTGDAVYIDTDINNNWALFYEGTTAWGQPAHTGPGGTMTCYSASQMGAGSDIAAFSAVKQTLMSQSGALGGPTSQLLEAVGTTQSQSWVPWCGLNGYLWYNNLNSYSETWTASQKPAAPYQEIVSVQDYANTTCSTAGCQMFTKAWATISSNNLKPFNFDAQHYFYECDGSSTGPAGRGPDCQLAGGFTGSSSTTACWISGISGYWLDVHASATIYGDVSDNHWHVKVTNSTQNPWTYVWATCMNIPQSL